MVNTTQKIGNEPLRCENADLMATVEVLRFCIQIVRDKLVLQHPNREIIQRIDSMLEWTEGYEVD